MVQPARRRPAAEVAWRPESPEARQLALSLRHGRLTIVIGPAPAQLGALLTGGVLPLLGRRALDIVVPVPADGGAMVLPFPERRRRPAEPAAEILVLLDAHRDGKLEALESRFQAAVLAAGVAPRSSEPRARLADRIATLADRHGSRFLFLVDGFEALLGSGLADVDDAGAALLNELVAILNRPLAANLLVTVSDQARARLDDALLARLHEPEVTLVELAATVEGGDAPPPRRAVRLATPPERNPPERTREPVADSRPAEAFAPSSRPSPAPRRRAPPNSRRLLAAAALACAALVAIGWFARPADRAAEAAAADRVAPPPSQRAEGVLAPVAPAVSAVAPALAPVPAFELIVEADARRAPALAVELAAALAADAPGSVVLRTVQRATTAPVSGPAPSARLAITRYDELRAGAEAGAVRSAAPLHVLAPLPAESVYVVVRDSGPLATLGDLRGRRLNLGPADGGRARTGRLLYRQMFGSEVPAHPAAALDDTAALQALAGGADGLDAVLLVGAPARARLAALPAGERRALRLLGAATDDPAARKALQLYLPATIDGLGAAPVRSLASLGFLVADAAAPAQHAALVGTLCRQLERLQRDGDPRWREIRPGQQLPLALRRVDTRVLETAWARCAPPAATTASTR